MKIQSFLRPVDFCSIRFQVILTSLCVARYLYPTSLQVSLHLSNIDLFFTLSLALFFFLCPLLFHSVFHICLPVFNTYKVDLEWIMGLKEVTCRWQAWHFSCLCLTYLASLYLALFLVCVLVERWCSPSARLLRGNFVTYRIM